MTNDPQNCVVVTWVGSKPVVGDLRKRMFAVFDALRLMPATWTLGDDPSRPFTPGSAGWSIEDTVTYARDEAPKFTLDVYGAPTPTVALRAPAPVTVSTIQRFAELAERVAEVLEPDIAWVTDLRQPKPPLDDRARSLTEMVHGAKGRPPHYRRRGPGGLGLRTFLGPYLVAQIGRELLMTLPPPTLVSPCAWGGLKIDLVPEPWNAETSDVLHAFEAARTHLEPAQFFSRVSVSAAGAISFRQPEHPSPSRDVGGRTR